MGKWLQLMVAVAVVLTADGVQNRNQGRWRWPESEAAALPRPVVRQTASREGAGRHIPNRPTFQIGTTKKPDVKITGARLKNPARVIVPIVPKVISTTTTTTTTTTSTTTTTTPSTPLSTTKKSVPLLKDAGKPGNPYVLLNAIFPPEDFIRTEEEELASYNSLRGKDLGGLDASEVYVADDDLFVVRGFNYKRPYTADPAGPPISDYEAPKPLPPPIPEPGTVFYPRNPDDSEDTSAFLPDEVNGIFNPFFGGEPPFNDSILPQLPYPFLPPPPPHWDSAIEFDNEIFEPFDPSPIDGSLPPQSELPAVQGDRPPLGIPGSPPFVPPQGEPKSPQNPQAPEQRQQQPPQPSPSPSPPPSPPPSANQTFVDDDDDLPFTPLFPDRSVEFYYPTHNTTEVPPGPYGPGVFVPPPEGFFADRNRSAALDAPIPSFLLKPPLNIPNYYIKTDNKRGKQQQQQRPQWPLPLSLSEGDGAMQYLPPSVLEHADKTTKVSASAAAPTISPLAQLVLNSGPELEQQKHPAGPSQPQHQQQPAPETIIYVNHIIPTLRPHRFHGHTTFRLPISLESDTDVNFKPERPPINPESELVDVSSQLHQQTRPAAAIRPANYVSVYRYGEGGYSYQLSS